MLKSLNELFTSTEPRFAQKALDFYDGKQYEHVVEMLDEPNQGRASWREKGLRVIFRNITKKIINKSGLLYIKGAPTIEVWRNEVVDDRQTAVLNEVLHAADFNEFMINFDSVVRLLKTAMVLVQYDLDSDSIILDVLHRGNSYVICDPITKKPNTLIYKTHEDEENYSHYRIFTKEAVEDWKEAHTSGSEPIKVGEEENPYGMVPVSVFYDTNKPRTGFWIEAPKEMVMFNEILNMHMIDLEFAASWSVHQTLFTNCNIEGEEYGDVSFDQEYQQKLPRPVSQKGLIGGLGKVVHLDTTGVESPFIEYKGPVVDMAGSHDLYKDWCRDYADDWSVTVKMDGDGNANVSGFSLVVQEKDNLELRQERQRMAEAGLQRLMHVIHHIWNFHHANVFTDDMEIFVDFTQPKLPFDKLEDEELWSKKIQEGRASIIDYLIEKEKLSREEAEERLAQIRKDQNMTFIEEQ